MIHKCNWKISRQRLLPVIVLFALFTLNSDAAATDSRPQPDFSWEQWPLPTSTLQKAAAPAPTVPASRHWVRAAYIIPSNRTAQDNAVMKMRHAVLMAHAWYKDQMERNGFGPKTFRYETESDGRTPLIHTINVPEIDAYFATDTYNRIGQSAQNAGLSVGTPGEVWILVYEGHGMDPDGTITRTFATGGTLGSGSDEGRCVFTANTLALLSDADLLDERSWSGMIIPAIGPYPLTDKSIAWYDGTTVSQLSSVMHGVMIHEFSHALGLGHDFRNDNIWNGDMMGFGMRGFRGWIHPEKWVSDYSRLSYGAALDLNNSRYFNPERSYNEDQKPTVTPLTTGTVTPSNGCIQISFSARDLGSPLTMAWLQFGYDLVAEMPLTAYNETQTFTTSYFNPGSSNQYIITVQDAQGNRLVYIYSLAVPSGYNRAPRAFVSSNYSAVPMGQSILFSAGNSTDPDNSLSELKVEWDCNNDGVYDTLPSYTKWVSQGFSQSGIRLVRARVTDPAGAFGISAPLVVRITETVNHDLVWIDRFYIGPESGTLTNPFNTIPEGISAVNSGGTVRILASDHSEPLRITKPMRIEASGGSVRIGAQ